MEEPSGHDLLLGVGRKIAEIRAHRGLTQETFAEALGIALRNLQRLESGRANLTLTSLARIAHTLDVEPADLLQPPENRAIAKGRPRARPKTINVPVGAATARDAHTPIEQKASAEAPRGDAPSAETAPTSAEAVAPDGSADRPQQ